MEIGLETMNALTITLAQEPKTATFFY